MGDAAAKAACGPAPAERPGRRVRTRAGPNARVAGPHATCGRASGCPTAPYAFAPSPLTRTRHLGGPEPSPLICFTTTRPSTSRVV